MSENETWFTIRGPHGGVIPNILERSEGWAWAVFTNSPLPSKLDKKKFGEAIREGFYARPIEIVVNYKGADK